RLETNNNARSTNVTFGDDTASNTAGGGGPFEKNSDTVYVGQAYGGYKGFPGFTFTGGRMPNPLVTTRMVWDPDINPEGLAEQYKHTFVFGGEPPPPPSYSKDGKAVVAPKPPEPFRKLDVFATFAQFVYDDPNQSNPAGKRGEYRCGYSAISPLILRPTIAPPPQASRATAVSVTRIRLDSVSAN